MGSIGLNSPQLSLDLKPTEMPKSLNAFLKEISMIGNDSEKKLKVVEYVAGLEEEMKKIEVFKRELPLCMLLLKDAIETLKEEMKQCKTSEEEIQPVMEEFIPSKSKLEEAILDKEKKNWMSSAQLWSSNGYPDSDTPTHCDKNQNSSEIKERVEEDRPSAAKNPLEPTYKFWNGVGPQAFLPFKGSAGTFVTTKKKEDKEVQSVPGLSLVIPGIKTHGVIEPSLNSKSKSSSMNQEQSNSHMYSQQQQAQRKQRRCWSPELHRRFVGALQQLGGSQAATPKQIRELMKVDGLTNDEVKSHLQKYRLHTRRLPNGSAGSNQSVCVLGGLWVPQDNQYETSKSKTTSPDGPLQLGSGTAGNSMEDDEDAKSETYSWNHSHKSVESAA